MAVVKGRRWFATTYPALDAYAERRDSKAAVVATDAEMDALEMDGQSFDGKTVAALIGGEKAVETSIRVRAGLPLRYAPPDSYADRVGRR